MRSQLADALGISHPVFGFSHTPAVVAAISRHGGLGVLGTALLGPADLERELSWLDANLDGRPYGVDIVFPAGSDASTESGIPAEHQASIDGIAARFGVRSAAADPPAEVIDLTPERGYQAMATVLRHRPALIVCGLGAPPPDLVRHAHAGGIAVAGMVGRPEHVPRHLELGVDAVIAVGTEGAGHTGGVTTMVLVPQVVEAAAGTPVLAGGGIAHGSQLAAALALGADGAWIGSLWLVSDESDVDPIVKHKILQAGSTETVRSRVFTGMPSRRLRTAWTDALMAPDAPQPLAPPLQGRLLAGAETAIRRHRVAAAMGTPVGQAVGLLRETSPVDDLMERLVAEAQRAYESMTARFGSSRDGG